MVLYGVMTTDPTFFGLVIEYCRLGDLRTLLDAQDTEISNEQKMRILMDIAQVNEMKWQLASKLSSSYPDCHVVDYSSL